MEFNLYDKNVQIRPTLRDSKYRIDSKQDNLKEEPVDNKKSTNMDTIIKTIPLKEFALNKMIKIANGAKGNNKPLVSIEPDSNFDEYRMIYNPHT